MWGRITQSMDTDCLIICLSREQTVILKAKSGKGFPQQNWRRREPCILFRHRSSHSFQEEKPKAEAIFCQLNKHEASCRNSFVIYFYHWASRSGMFATGSPHLAATHYAHVQESGSRIVLAMFLPLLGLEKSMINVSHT